MEYTVPKCGGKVVSEYKYYTSLLYIMYERMCTRIERKSYFSIDIHYTRAYAYTRFCRSDVIYWNDNNNNNDNNNIFIEWFSFVPYYRHALFAGSKLAFFVDVACFVRRVWNRMNFLSAVQNIYDPVYYRRRVLRSVMFRSNSVIQRSMKFLPAKITHTPVCLA